MEDNVMIEIPTDQVLAKFGPDGEHWIQGGYDNGTGVCLHGAIRACELVPGDAGLVEQVAESQGWGPEWNDADDTKFDDVVAVVLSHPEVTDWDLAEVYGPSWEIVVDTARVIAAASLDDLTRLASTWSAEKFTAGTGMWGTSTRGAAATATVARGAPIDGTAATTAANAAWNAASAAVHVDLASYGPAAVRDAARAASIVDLIGQHDWTIEHHKTLAGPFVKVFPDSALAEVTRMLEG
jgi:hypothetical protein